MQAAASIRYQKGEKINIMSQPLVNEMVIIPAFPLALIWGKLLCSIQTLPHPTSPASQGVRSGVNIQDSEENLRGMCIREKEPVLM